MTDIASRAMAFVQQLHRTPFIWGESDCTAWPAAWIEAEHGRPVARPYWHSEAEAMRLIAEAGSLDALWCDVLSGFGLRRGEAWETPEIGDVGIIDTRLAGQVGGMFLNHGNFIWRGDPFGTRMIHARRHTIVAFWKVCAP